MASIVTMYILVLIQWLFFSTPRLPSPSPSPSLGLLADAGIILDAVLGRNIKADSAKRFLHLLPSSLSSHVVSSTCKSNL